MFIVLSSWQSHCKSSHGSHDEYSMPLSGHLPLNQANQPVNRIHHRHLLLLLSLKADTHFTVPHRIKG